MLRGPVRRSGSHRVVFPCSRGPLTRRVPSPSSSRGSGSNPRHARSRATSAVSRCPCARMLKGSGACRHRARAANPSRSTRDTAPAWAACRFPEKWSPRHPARRKTRDGASNDSAEEIALERRLPVGRRQRAQRGSMTNQLVSMTGFGRASAALGSRTVSVEIRSLNHRGLDVKVRAHDLRLAPEIETEMLRMVRGRLTRGSVTLSVSDETTDASGATVDVARVRQLHAVLDGLRKELGLAEPADLATVGAFLGVSRTGPAAEVTAACWPALAPAS